MTRKKHPWGQQRGWIVPADGSPPQELPPHMVVAAIVAGRCRSDPFDLEPALEEPVLNLLLALKLGHLHELTNKVASR